MTSSTSTGRTRKSMSPPMLAALVVGLLTLLVGLFVTTQQKQVYSATVNVVVVPGTTTDVQESAMLFDSLSRGQIAATAAQLYTQDRWHPSTPDVVVSAGTIAPSSMIKILARGTDPEAVSAAAADTVNNASSEVDALLKPYRAVAMETDRPEPTPVGLSKVLLLGITVVGALVAGALAAAATNAVRGYLRRKQAV